MKAWEEYAFVLKGKVQNISCFAIGSYTAASITGHDIYGDECEVINVTQIPTEIGDTYREGKFYHVDDEGEETEIPAYDTEEEAISKLQSSVSASEDNISSNAGVIDDILILLLEG